MKLKEMLDFDVEKKAEELTEFIKRSIKEFRTKGVIIGLSGGIDSACVCGLAVKAVGANQVFGLLLPEQDSDPKSEEDAIAVANQYGVRTKTVDITPVLDAYKIYDLVPKNAFSHRESVAKLVKLGYSIFPKSHSPFIGGLKGTRFGFQRRIQAYYRIKHRVRMVYLYYYGEQLNYLITGTANRTELLTGFFVKHGDGAADIMPILDLYKTQVRRLAQFLGVPRQVIEKPPIPDLIPGIEDEGALGMSYEKLDLILVGFTNGKSDQEIMDEMNISKSGIKYIKAIIKLSEGLRSPPLGPNA